MTKTLRILLVGAALIGAAAPALARGDAGGGPGGGSDGGTSNAWDPTIAGIEIPRGRTHPGSVPERRVAEERRDEICGLTRGVVICRPR